MPKSKKTDFEKINNFIAKNRAIQELCRDIVEKKVLFAKQSLIQKFESHPVSQEIKSGSTGSNSSGTLGGYGNLFSFIGFNAGDTPVQNWTNFIRQKIKNQGIIKLNIKQDSFNLIFGVSKIDPQDFIANAAMPWEAGRSWITGIERGISGFSNYIAKNLIGRSAGGIQSKHPVRGNQFARTSYWSKMWKEFEQDLLKN